MSAAPTAPPPSNGSTPTSSTTKGSAPVHGGTEGAQSPSLFVPLPCERCNWMPEDCTCIADPIAVHRARTEVAKRHRAAVQLARVSRRHDRRAA
jgi:hypothetical protein